MFDSGVGGLSTFAAVRARVPGASYHYCSDNLNFPYGTKSEAECIRCATDTATKLIERCRLDMLVVACNTMSVVALPALRARWSIPVVGVVPAIKPAAAGSKTRVVALLATPGTVARRYTDELIAAHADGCRVVKVGSSALVEMAEAKLRGEPVDLAVVRREIAPMFVDGLDAGVLGCTHFPLLLPELEAASPWPIRWHDSAPAIAARVAYLLAERAPRLAHPHLADAAARLPEAWFTAAGPSVDALKPALQKLGFGAVGVL